MGSRLQAPRSELLAPSSFTKGQASLTSTLSHNSSPLRASIFQPPPTSNITSSQQMVDDLKSFSSVESSEIDGKGRATHLEHQPQTFSALADTDAAGYTDESVVISPKENSRLLWMINRRCVL